MRCNIGLDDTDHLESGCTTFTFDGLLRSICESLECDIVERRLVRLWPFAKRRTRGNGALGAILDFPENCTEKLENLCNDWFSELLLEISEHPESEFPASPCLAISYKPVPKKWYWEAVRKNVDPTSLVQEATERGVTLLHAGTLHGAVGACAAISWENNPNSSWELISWRDESRIGTSRKVSPESVFEMGDRFPETFLNRDPTKGEGMISPRTPCPVLYGIRGSSPEAVENAHYWLQSRSDVESSFSFAIHRTNQISDDHIESPESGAVTSFPNEMKGGHAHVSVYSSGHDVKLVAFSEGGPVNRLLRSLIPGDRISWAGLVSPDGSIHLEKLKLDFPTARILSRPICCSRTMRSSGRGQGLRCKFCGRKEEKFWHCYNPESPVDFPIDEWLEPSPTNRRHLSRPLSHGFPGTN